MSEYTRPAPAISKHAHKKGCHGSLFRTDGIVFIDRLGRIGNGSWIAHLYVCNRRWAGCKAKVVITETAVRAIAVEAEQRDTEEAAS